MNLPLDNIIEDYLNRIFLKVIYKKYKITKTILYSILGKNNIIRRGPQKIDSQKWKEMTIDYNNGLSINQLSKKYSVSTQTIAKYLPNYTKIRSLPEACRKYSDEQIKIICNRYKSGMTMAQAGEIFGVSDVTVSNYIKKFKIKKNKIRKKIKKNKIRKKITKKIDIDDVIRRYENGEKLLNIAKDYKVCRQTLTNRLKKINYELTNNQRILYKKETEIEKLYKDGFSCPEIAEKYLINNSDTVWKFIKKRNLIRSPEEVRKLVSKKLSGKIYKSKIHQKLENMLKNKGIKFQSEFSIDGWNFDVKVNNVLIEVQGEYWHKLPNRLNKDRKKRKVAIANNYKLLYIWESQFNNIEFINHWVDYHFLDKCINFSFGDIEIIKSDKKSVENLIKLWHYSRKIGNFSTSYVAILNNKIIAIVVFGPPTRQEIAIKQNIEFSKILELNRFCIDPNYHKKNFGTWFLSRAIKKLKKDKSGIKKLISFTDPSFNNYGTLYKANNWIFDGKTKPNYWYVNKNRTILHKKSVWNKAKKLNMKESQYAQDNNLIKVIGESKLRFIFNL